jgi:hypothetical protein
MIVLFDSTVVGDKTPLLKKVYDDVANTTGLDFHPKYRYCTSSVEDCEAARPKLKKLGFELKYFSGCFDPYLCKRR